MPELKLNCSLQVVVVHVPGLCMINKGTDGLSRGIWMTALQGFEDSGRLTQVVFEPLCFNPLLVVESYLAQAIPSCSAVCALRLECHLGCPSLL
jgi:hypothetical protein